MIIDKLPIQEGELLAGRYRIGKRLGTGGMGAVFLAEDRKLPGKKWAVKASVRHSHNLKGFEEEARLLARLEHPFLPKIADFFPPDSHGFSYLIMDYVSGEDLLQKHQRGGYRSGKSSVMLPSCASCSSIYIIWPPRL
ncbi:protein kinase [Paenibacillus sp. CC-CFT747]|nr:protein kinase [Paenibacillus sp. CC-CFT747]